MLLQMALFHSFYGWVLLHCICVSHLLYPLVDGHLGCSFVLTIVNSIVMNVRVHVSFQIIMCLFQIIGRIFSQYISRSGTVGSYGDSSNVHWNEYSLEGLRQYSLEGLVLKLKLQYFGLLTWKTDSLEKTLILRDWRKKEGERGWDGGWHHRLDGHEFEQARRAGDGQGSLACSSHGVTKSRTRLSDWTELNWWGLHF